MNREQKRAAIVAGVVGVVSGVAGLALWAATRDDTPTLEPLTSFGWVELGPVLNPGVTLPAGVLIRESTLGQVVVPATVGAIWKPVSINPIPMMAKPMFAEVPIYRGMPPMPAGATAQRIWKNGEPRPDRFRQWSPLTSNLDRATYELTFQGQYWFGAIVGDDFGWYVLRTGKAGGCCDVARRSLYPAEGWERKGNAGRVAGLWQCETAPDECWNIIPRPHALWASHERIRDSWPDHATGNGAPARDVSAETT